LILSTTNIALSSDNPFPIGKLIIFENIFSEFGKLSLKIFE
jgi:hypothetical protein